MELGALVKQFGEPCFPCVLLWHDDDGVRERELRMEYRKDLLCAFLCLVFDAVIVS